MSSAKVTCRRCGYSMNMGDVCGCDCGGCSDCGSPFADSHAGDCPAAKRGNLAKARELPLDDKTLASVRRGLQQAAEGKTSSLGSFAQYAWEVGDKVEWDGGGIRKPRTGTLIAIGPDVCLVDDGVTELVAYTKQLTRPAPKKRVVEKQVWLYRDCTGELRIAERLPLGLKAVAGPVTVPFEVEGEDDE